MSACAGKSANSGVPILGSFWINHSRHGKKAVYSMRTSYSLGVFCICGLRTWKLRIHDGMLWDRDALESMHFAHLPCPVTYLS